MFFMFTDLVFAGRGCCSHHGGVAGCNSYGKQVCNDGTLSPTCTCTPTVTYVYGCTDSGAKNYNSKANKDDGSCEYYKYGCIDEEASNYDASAEKNDGSCVYYKYGCTDRYAINYDFEADKDDGSCKFATATFDDNESEKQEEIIIDDNASDDTDGNDSFFGFLLLCASGYGIYKTVNKNKKKS